MFGCHQMYVASGVLWEHLERLWPPWKGGYAMLKTGVEYLESIRDGRRVYIGSEEVPDVTTHPAFRNAAQSFARLYDRKRDADNLAVMSYEEDGERYSTWFLRPRSRDDLR